ncbi:hypothetical protein KIW84_031951 [Lathyrus oleraceus]|uniref:Helitron helicase-like domain-containing protein n=1 Tax=Pisum sativum TaxID=3888 RepID=A0A9D4XWA9_PEA|nr:hypothetical protein KIW84_031951 [Pisum sativum]
MSRKVDSVKDINDSKETWRLAVRIMDVWSVVNNKSIEHLEMIVMDSLGDRIQVLIRHDHLLKWKEVIKENMTCIINNGSVYNNDFQWKVCDHSKKIVFLGGTTMKAIELQNIPPKGYFFKDFGEILQGKCKTDRLEDIIGAVSEINHIQSNTPGKKVVVSVVLKDLKGNCINCNLWEIYGSNEAQTLLRSRRLYQQFLVDGFTMMESERLRSLRKNQSKLRVGKYHNLNEYNSNGETHGSNTGKRVVLPSSYVGSRRYMDQLYFDGMAKCSYVGFPDLFITFTCNPNWPEIQRLLGSVHLKASDRPDIISRVFKMKFDELLSDLTKKSLLGKVLAYMYTIEFQKRGLPHAHILIFLHPSNKYPTPSDIDRIISAEIPDQDTNEEFYNLVKTHMIHGPCGFANRSSPRRDNGHTVLKNGIQVDNRNIVPYNAKLLAKYQAHINMEWCNQSTSIKYLFKYINKGYNRITAAIVPNDDGTSNQSQNIDEIKQYIDCRYVSPSEASWRIFSFPIHGRKPVVERLYFHCEGQNSVYYTDFDRINTVLEKPSVTESMFTSWFEANCKYPEAQNLTYSKFVSKFVYVKKKREWKPRLKGYTIGRLIWVPPTTGELYYLRLMLTHVKGPRSYNDIKTVNNVKYDTFRDACFAMGFIGNDREFIAAIKEANHWGSVRGVISEISTSTDTRILPEKVFRRRRRWKEEALAGMMMLILEFGGDNHAEDDEVEEKI